MGMYNVLRHDGHEIQFKTGDDNLIKYVVGDVCPGQDEGIYAGFSSPDGQAGQIYCWWVIIKCGRLEAVVPWVENEPGCWHTLDCNCDQLEELQEHYGVPWE